MIDTIACPNCQRKLNLPPECEGQDVICPACKTEFKAVAMAPPAPQPAITQAAPFPPPLTVHEEEVDPGTFLPPSPRRRPRLSRTPPSKPSGAKWLVAVPVGGAVFMACLCGVIRSCDRSHHVVQHNFNPPNFNPQPNGFPKDGFLKDGFLKDGFPKIDLPKFVIGGPLLGDNDPQLQAALAVDLAPLFNGLSDAVTAGDAKRIASHFDTQRMAQEMVAQHLVALIQKQPGPLPPLAEGFRAAVTKSLQEQPDLFRWQSTEVKHARRLGPNQVVVIARHRRADGGVLKMRWWVVHHAPVWSIYDMENVELGMRATFTAVGAVGAGNDNFGQALIHLQEARLAIVRRQDAETAQRLLDQAGAGGLLPASVVSVSSATKVAIELQRGQHQAAMLTLDAWQGQAADAPLISYYRGRAFNQQRRHDQALAVLSHYRQVLGDDTLLCKELGDALRGLNRRPEAQKEYRAALDCDPKNADALGGLVQALSPGDPRDDLARRFRRLDKRAEHFAILLENCLVPRDSASLEILALEMQKIDPKSAAALHGLAIAKGWSGQAAQAAEAFQAALALDLDPDRRHRYTTSFLLAMAQSGLAHTAYAVAPQKRDAFELLAGELQKDFALDELPPLVAAHAKADPDDPLLPFYQGVVYVQRGQYEKADKAFAIGLALPPGPVLLDTFRASRVTARFHIGKGMSAYRTIGPRRDTFVHLAEFCLTHDNLDLLSELIAEHAKTQAKDPDLLRYRFRLTLRQGKIADAIAQFKARLAEQPTDFARKGVTNTFLYDMASEDRAVEAYEAAPDRIEAFAVLLQAHRDQARMTELPKLIAVHTAKHADDPRLLAAQGAVLLNQGKWAEAADTFAAAWDRAADDGQRNLICHDCIYAHYKAGRWQEAYQKLSPAGTVFLDLAQLMAFDKKGDQLQDLLGAHIRQFPNDPNVLTFQAKARLFNKLYIQAAGLWRQAWQQQPDGFAKQSVVREMAIAFASAGQTVGGYRQSPDKAIAFEAAANRLVALKKTDELQLLVTEHGAKFPRDPWLAFYHGELALLRGEGIVAEKWFTEALANAPAPQRWQFRAGLWRAQIAAGKIAVAYAESGGTLRTFDDLAFYCLGAKNPGQLATLIDLERKNDPGNPGLAGWEIEVLLLKGEYAQAIEAIAKHRDELKRNPRFGNKFETHLIRCLVKLNRPADALKEAEAQARKNRFMGRMYLALAHASAGDAKQTLAVAEQAPRYAVDGWYADPDLGPLLRSDAMKAFRERYPEPKITP